MWKFRRQPLCPFLNWILMNKEIAFYIHIPFCKSKCKYCDFLSFSNMESRESYINSLVKEIENFETEAVVKSVFIGGGTPSIIESKYIGKIFKAFEKFDFAYNCEITIEANPGTLTEENLKDYKYFGINRISMGLQAWQNHHLKKLGRIHTCEEFVNSYNLAVNSGFENINVDTMFDLPDQTFEEWKETLEKVTALKPQHISAYSLIVEEGTPFYDMELNIPDEIQDREMYHFAQDFLAEKGYHQYEISNFAKENCESIHNNTYWIRGDYKGFGLGASSLINNHRLKNTENMAEYISGVYVTEDEDLTKEDIYSEFMFLGLRRNEGISIKNFEKLYGESIYHIFGDALNKHISEGLLEQNNDYIRLTRKGLDLANTVFVDFV